MGGNIGHPGKAAHLDALNKTFDGMMHRERLLLLAMLPAVELLQLMSIWTYLMRVHSFTTAMYMLTALMVIDRRIADKAKVVSSAGGLDGRNVCAIPRRPWLLELLGVDQGPGSEGCLIDCC